MKRKIIVRVFLVAFILAGLILAALTTGPAFADSTVYANAVSCTAGTCTSTAGAIDTNDGTYGVFDKASGGGTALTMVFTFGQTLTPETGTAVTIYYHFVKGSQDPWCQFYWNTSNGGSYTASTTLTNSGDYESSFAIDTSTALYSVEVDCSANASAQTDNVYYIKAVYTPATTPTPTASNTPTITSTPTTTATPTISIITYQGDKNKLQDGSFETFPQLQFLGLSPWSTSWLNGTVSRQTYSVPEGWANNQQVNPLCGGSFYQIDAPAGDFPPIGQFDHTGPYVEQGFDWGGGPMYVNMGTQTSDANTQGWIQLQKPDNSIAVLGPDLSSLAGWKMNFWQVSDAPAGHYTIQVKARTLDHTTAGHMAIDAISVHEGYWVNDCNVPPELWSKESRAEAVQTATPGGPTATPDYAMMTADTGTRIAAGDSTQESGSTATQHANATATEIAGETATKQVIVIENNWVTVTHVAAVVQTLLADGNATIVAEGHQTQTQMASGLTATAVHNATGTAFVQNFRGTMTAAAAQTQTAVSRQQTQNAGQLATYNAVRTQAAYSATQTAAAYQTQSALAGPFIILTLQASVNGTNAAVLTQAAGTNLTQAAVVTSQYNANLTAIAQLTVVSNGTTAAQATSAAQAQATSIANATSVAAINSTLQAMSTLQATQGTQGQLATQAAMQMPPLQPTVAWDAQCNRPDTPLNLAWWADYERCEALSWFAWGPQNNNEVQVFTTEIQTYEPFGTLAQLAAVLRQINFRIGSEDWTSGSSCSGQQADPDLLIQQARGLLLGQLTFGDSTYTFNDDCNLKLSPIVGPYITKGMCVAINLLCLLGVMQWLQWLANAIFIGAFILYLKNNWLDRMVG